MEGKDVLVVNEGANTMDIGRTMMQSVRPRRRLDAGTFGEQLSLRIWKINGFKNKLCLIMIL